MARHSEDARRPGMGFPIGYLVKRQLGGKPQLDFYLLSFLNTVFPGLLLKLTTLPHHRDLCARELGRVLGPEADSVAIPFQDETIAPIGRE